MKNSERTIYLYDLKVEKRAVHAQVPPLVDICNVWEAAFNAEKATHFREKETVVYRIGDMQVDDAGDTVTLLIRRSDLSAPEAAYSRFDTGKLRIAKKTKKEGGDTAAHLVISLKSEKGAPGTYLALLEGIPHISHHFVQALLNRIIRSSCKADESTFTYSDPSGATTRNGPKRHPFKPLVKLRGHIADDFGTDLENGTVSNIELVSAEEMAPLGGNKYLSEQKSILKVSVNKDLPKAGRLKSLIKAMVTRKENFETGRIIFKDPDNKSHTIEIDLNSGTPQQQLYVKNFVIPSINPLLAQSTDQILERLRDPMKARLTRDRNV